MFTVCYLIRSDNIVYTVMNWFRNTSSSYETILLKQVFLKHTKMLGSQDCSNIVTTLRQRGLIDDKQEMKIKGMSNNNERNE